MTDETVASASGSELLFDVKNPKKTSLRFGKGTLPFGQTLSGGLSMLASAQSTPAVGSVGRANRFASE